MIKALSSWYLRVLTVALTSVGTRGTALSDTKWIELENGIETVTYDLHSVEMLDPGKFTIIATSIDHPDVMRFRLSVLTALRGYCTRPDGKYPPPGKLFSLGKPDMTIQFIQVNTRYLARGRFKNVVWGSPYHKMALTDPTGLVENPNFFDCEGPAVSSSDEEYNQLRSDIINGLRTKELYDCRRGVVGTFVNEDDPPSKVVAGVNIKGVFAQAYIRLCHAITGEYPYIPSNFMK